MGNVLLEDSLCTECRSRMDSKVQTFCLNGIKITSLYIYKEDVRNNILRYKESKDKFLANIFIHPYWAWRFKKYTAVFVPSTIKANEKRGFSHMKEILLASNFKDISSCLTHHGTQEQALVPHCEKTGVKAQIMLENPDLIKNRKVLLVDDILTTGETMTACINLLIPHVKELRCLVIASGGKWYKKTSSCRTTRS